MLNTLTYPANRESAWYTARECFCEGMYVFLGLLSVQLLFMGCNGTGKGEDTGLPNALNDQDAGSPTPDADDNDIDGATDVDVDAGPPEYAEWAVTGRVEYLSTNNSTVACDATIGLQGTGFVGECEGCDYAFSMEPTIEDDRGDAETCEFNPLLSFVSDGVRENLILAHADEAYIDQDDVEVLILNSVRVGFSLYYEATDTSEAVRIEGPFWWQMYYDDIEKESTFSREDDSLQWTFAFENTVATWDDFAMLDDCGEELTDEATDGFIGDRSQTGSVPCDGWQADVWEVDLAEGDDGFQVSVDTISAATTFDPAILVNDPDGCATLYADDGFDCTHPPPHYMCPAGTVDGRPGTYQIMVFSYGQCASGDVEYKIEIAGEGVAETLVLAMDNVDRFENLEFTNKRIEVAGCADLFEGPAPPESERCVPAFEGSDDHEDTGDAPSDTGFESVDTASSLVDTAEPIDDPDTGAMESDDTSSDETHSEAAGSAGGDATSSSETTSGEEADDGSGAEGEEEPGEETEGGSGSDTEDAGEPSSDGGSDTSSGSDD